MKEVFGAYYPPTKDELKEIWDEGEIVLDTNTLLNFFRYSPSTRDQFLQVLEELEESLWLPYQVGLEFHQRKSTVLKRNSDAFSKVKESIKKAKNEIEGKLNEYKHHPTLNRDELMEHLETTMAGFTDLISKREEAYRAEIVDGKAEERTFSKIGELFSNRVGNPFDKDELSKIYEEGEQRYENKIPPGYEDASKPGDRKYGDLVIWKEILRRGKEKKLPIIFVTDDAKEDWWRRDNGKTLGARIELIEEFSEHAGQRIHLYDPLQFLRYATEKTAIPMSDESFVEIEQVSQTGVAEARYAALISFRNVLKMQLENFSVFHPDSDSLKAAINTRESSLGEIDIIQNSLLLQRKRSRMLRNALSHADMLEEKTEVIGQMNEVEWETARLEEELRHLQQKLQESDHVISGLNSRKQEQKHVLEQEIGQINEQLEQLAFSINQAQ